VDHLALPIHHDQVCWRKGPLVHSTGCHQQLQRRFGEHPAEVASGAIAPAPLMDGGDHLAEGGGFLQLAIGRRRGGEHLSEAGGVGGDSHHLWQWAHQ